MNDSSYEHSIAVVLGGDGSVATIGFWAALNIATTRRLPMLFLIEDNGYGLSVPSTVQTPGGDISKNLAAFADIEIVNADTTEPAQTARAIFAAVSSVRAGTGPVMLRLVMPRLSGHSGQDTQTYKTSDFIAREKLIDPLIHLRDYLVPAAISHDRWSQLEAEAAALVEAGLAAALDASEEKGVEDGKVRRS